jgi:hypothetical protein
VAQLQRKHNARGRTYVTRRTEVKVGKYIDVYVYIGPASED